MAATEIEAPPVGEEIHMPEPSLLPILNAAGLSLAIVGITISLVMTRWAASSSSSRWSVDPRRARTRSPSSPRSIAPRTDAPAAPIHRHLAVTPRPE